MQPYIVPIIFQIAGIAVALAEVLLPSGGLLAVIAAGCLGYSLYLAFTMISTTVGMFFIFSDIIILPVIIIAGLKLLARSPLALKSSLSRQAGFTAADERLRLYQGQSGLALTNLRPAGTARIDGQRVDVVTRGDYIEKGAAIVVIAVQGNRVIVQKIDPDN